MILLLAFALLVYNINAPVTTWREADTAAMARNFCENRYNILYPQIDWGGGSSGYVECEFPIYQFAIATMYQAFGVNEALARLLSAVFTLGSIYFVYALARRLIGEKAAIWSAAFFGFLPLQIVDGHLIMPETLLILGISAGVYFFYRWYQQSGLANLLISAGFISVACLIKPQTMYLFLPLIYLAWLRDRSRLFLRPQNWLFVGIVLLPLIAWYYHAHQLSLESGLSFGTVWGYGSDKWGNWDLVVTPQFWKTIFFYSLAPQLAVFGMFVLYAGLLIKRHTREEYLLDFWMIALLVYVVVVAKGNFVHGYYLAPAIVPISMIMGKVYARYIPKFAWNSRSLPQLALLAALAAMIVAAVIIDLPIIRNQERQRRVELAKTIQAHSKPDDLIVTVDNVDPTLLYLSHRKGWAISSADMEKTFPGASYFAGFNYDKSFFYEAQKGQT